MEARYFSSESCKFYMRIYIPVKTIHICYNIYGMVELKVGHVLPFGTCVAFSKKIHYSNNAIYPLLGSLASAYPSGRFLWVSKYTVLWDLPSSRRCCPVSAAIFGRIWGWDICKEIERFALDITATIIILFDIYLLFR